MSSRTPALLSDSHATTIADALKRSARHLVLFSAFVGIAIFAVLTMVAPRYQSEAKLTIIARGSPSTNGEIAPEAIATSVRALRSPFVLERVADDLALDRQREFNSALGPLDGLDATLRAVGLGQTDPNESERHRVLAALRDSLDVHVAESGKAIAVRATSLDPELSAKIADAVGETYGKMLTQEAKIDRTGLAAPLGVNQGKDDAPPLDAKILSNARPDPVPSFPKIAELSAIASVAALMFGIAFVVMTTALRAMPKNAARKRRSSPKKRGDPLLTSLPDEPLLKDVSDGDSRVEPGTGSPHAMSSALNAVAAKGGSSAQDASAPTTFAEIELLAARLKERRPSGGGHRALITSDAEQVIPYPEAFELAKALASSGAQTVLIDWSPSGEGFGRTIGLETIAGWNDLMSRGARFDHIIQRLPGTHAQAIASGGPLRSIGIKMDADLINLALDALDEVYDHIIVTARHGEARVLFECIEGRFDAGITVVPNGETPSAPDSASAFIGFEVADIDVVRFQRPEPVVSAMAQRIARATRQPEAMTQSA
jgi:capsular polysaccharide biosynthesis protein/Mrp family chromosome partitioning ATPase